MFPHIPDFCYTSLLCIRYLSGIISLPNLPCCAGVHFSNSFKICMLKKAFLLPLYLKDTISGCRIQVACFLFSINILNVSSALHRF